jgi:hypothetical protein
MREPTQLDRIETLLMEIRDRLPAPPPESAPMLFGYKRGQDETPSMHQVVLAYAFLRGELGDGSTVIQPALAHDLAREIIAAAGLDPPGTER